ncbi:MAG: AbrB/MazE/SpoVT family DNA-binding domain-containing protein [Terriglobales bacterium]
MLRRITTVSSKGQFVIPAEIRASLAIEPGTRISVAVEDSRIVLEPVSKALVERTRGMLKGGPSLSAALKKERQKDKW